MRHSKLILIFLLGALYFSLSLLSPQDTKAAWMIDGSYAPCPTTCDTPNPGTCSISEPGSCNACTGAGTNNDCCDRGTAWTKYTAVCKLANPEFGECNWVWDPSGDVCSTGDKYNPSNGPVMNAGYCDCTVGGGYKTCCSGGNPVPANYYTLDNYNPPYEADCGGNTTVICGVGSCAGLPSPCTTQPCGQTACDSLIPPPTPPGSTPTPTPAPTPPPGTCTPYSQGAICNTGSCSDGSVCAQGHYYCLWDGSGWGSCSEEVNNCATQCTNPPPPPPPSGCNFGACGAGCSSDQRYIQGDCSSYSWYVGPGCYHDDSCFSGGGSSNISCSATSPVTLGNPTTISITTNPKLDRDACYYNPMTANVTGPASGSCNASGYGQGSPTNSCNYTPSAVGNYSVSVYWPGHSDLGHWECDPPDYTTCRWIPGCGDGGDPQQTIYCNFTTNYPPPPTPTVSTALTCIPNAYNGSGFTISWTTNSSPAVTQVQISTASNFATYSYKAVSGTSTTAPSGFSGNLTFNSSTTYYVRLWNGNQYSSAAAFTTPARCVLPCPGGLGACGDSTASPSTIGTCDGVWSPNPGPDTTYNLWCAANVNPTRGYCYQCVSNLTPWFQSTGDVHSNDPTGTGINAPGGP